ncbi:MAG: hypothetical protein ACLPXT_10695 [Terracidiphilus sp.]
MTAAAAGAAPSAFQGQNATWSYDSYGNRTAQSFTNGVYSNWANYNPANNRITTASSAPAGYVYDGVPVDRSSSTGWDASGNTIYDGNNEYWYDAEGQLCTVQSLAVAGLPFVCIRMLARKTRCWFRNLPVSLLCNTASEG